MATFVFALGIVALIVGLMTRRLIIGGVASIGLLLYYFYLIGHGNWLLLILFAIGILFILAEVFLPTFGILGLIGLGLAAGGLIQGTGDVWTAMTDLSVGFLLAIIVFFILLKMGYRLPISERMVLQRAVTQSGNKLQRQDLEVFINQEGETITPLRPTGKACLDSGEVLEVVSEFEIIDANQRIQVTRVKDNQLIVRRK